MKKKLVSILLVSVMLSGLLVVSGTVATPPEEKIPVIIMFKDQQNTKLIEQYRGEIKTVYHLKPALAASLPENAVENLKRNQNIEYIVRDLPIFKMEETYDWGVDRIDADIAHANNNKGTAVNIAILDTGIDYNHPDLAANYAGGYDFADGDEDPFDIDGHGTHCAGIAAAILGNGAGVIGVAPEAKLYTLKVFQDDGTGSYSSVVSALEWCITHDVQVISMSFGSSYRDGDPGIEPWINRAYDAGIVLVGAAGNDGNWRGSGDNVIYPARYENVIAVAATDSSDRRASFPGWWSSSTGPDVELAAPGVSIYSSVPGGGYEAWSGTSMACPHVAGTVALVVASGISDGNEDGKINDELRLRLQTTAEDLGVAGFDTKYGYGLVDAEKAAAPAVNQPPVAHAGSDQTVSDTDNDGVELITLDGSGSFDSDGTIVAYEWTENNEQLSTEMEFTADFSVGTHTVTLTVRDDDDAIAEDEVIITVTTTGSSGNALYVQSIEMSPEGRQAGKNAFVWAVAAVTIVDAAGIPVDGATVSGTWSNATTDSDSGTTDATGVIALTSNSVKNPPPEGVTFTFTVNNVIKDGWSYDSAANKETSGSISVP